MKFQTIELTREGPLACLTFQRPEAYNALNDTMAAELLAAVQDVQFDPKARALLITGAGKAFHSGGDIKSFTQAGDQVHNFVDRVVIDFHAFISRLARMPKPVVGAVNGPAGGAGFSLMLACDMVLAREDAVFTMAYTRIGASPDGGSTFFLVRLLGLRRALELAYTNRVLTANEALDWGLVNQVLPSEGFLEKAKEFAQQLAEGPTQAFGRAKQLMLHSLDHDFEKQLELEARAIVESTQTTDFRKNIQAFVEKKPFSYQGK